MGGSRNPRFPLGVDIWPLDNDGAAPSAWYQHDVAADLDAASAIGLSLVRLYASWRVMEPQVGTYDDSAFDRLVELVDAAGERAMRAIVVLFSAEPHSDPASVSWSARRDPRTDPYLLERQCDLVARLAQRLRTSRALFGWQLADQAFLDDFASAEDLDGWARSVGSALREADPSRPVALGADPEGLARATRIDARASLARFEFATAHPTSSYVAFVAPGPSFTGPSTRLRGFLLQTARRGAPTLADGVGALDLEGSPAEEAAAMRLEIATSLVHGAAGAMVRRWRDMTTEPREPYRVDPHEVLVGVTDTDGHPKAAAGALADFASQIAAIDLAGVEPVPERLGVLLPAARFDALPSLGALIAPRAAFAAWRFAREAQLPATVAYEDDDYSGFSALVVPSAVSLKDETWDRLRAYVADGGALLASYGGGDAHASVRELFGVEFLGDAGARDTFDVRVAQPDLLGALRSVDAKLALPAFALLSPGDATVVATDARGNPLLTLNTFGQGRAVFLATPLERAIALSDERTLSPAVCGFERTVIGSVGRGAGCAAPIESDDPDVELGVFQGAEDDVVVVVNHSTEARTAKLASVRRVASVSDVRGGQPVAIGAATFGVPLAASGIAILRIAYG